MSQQKVDYHKNLKSNRKELVKKQKTQKKIAIGATILVCVLLITWIGFSGVAQYEKHLESTGEATTLDLSSISDYFTSLNSSEE